MTAEVAAKPSPLAPIQYHATTIALGPHGVLITGPSGSGKSDLALRLIDGGASLVADDQTFITIHDGQLYAASHARIAGQIEARGLGILKLPHQENTRLALALAPANEAARMPERHELEIGGVSLPCLHLPYLEASTPAKIRLWLKHEYIT